MSNPESKCTSVERRDSVDQFSRCRSSLSSEQICEILSKLKFFSFKGSRIRTIDSNGQRWIVFADICKALDYKNPSHQSKKVRSEEKCHLEVGLKNSLAVCINERGLYSFALFSNKESALEFYQWAVKEIFERW